MVIIMIISSLIYALLHYKDSENVDNVKKSGEERGVSDEWFADYISHNSDCYNDSYAQDIFNFCQNSWK